MHFFHLLHTGLMAFCALGSPVARRQLRAINQVHEGPSWNSTTSPAKNRTNIFGQNSLRNGTDIYKSYTGDGSCAAGWPHMDQWASFEYLWNSNLPLIANSCANIGTVGANNSPNETAFIAASILAIGSTTNIDPRFILAIMMQESKGCVRVQTTFGSNSNPGLMQSHAGPNSCVSLNPCPEKIIYGMLDDGVCGTPSGDGLAGIMDQLVAGNATNELAFGNDTSLPQLYYRTARMYNSGSMMPSGDLGQGVATHCYVSDIANRLTGWVSVTSTCTLDGATYGAPNTTVPAGNSTITGGCLTVQPGDTCNSVAALLGVSTATFMADNPSINAQCTNLLAGKQYCA